MSNTCDSWAPSPCSTVKDQETCKQTNTCEWVGNLCRDADGCFPFLFPKTTAQPYVLFLVGLLRDILTLVAVGAIAPRVILNVKQRLASTKGHKVTAIYLDKIPFSAECHSILEFTQQLAKQRYDTSAYDPFLSETEKAELILYALTTYGLWQTLPEERESLIVIALPRSANSARQDFVLAVKKATVEQGVFFSSSSLAKRINHGILMFPSDIQLVLYIAGALLHLGMILMGLRATHGQNSLVSYLSDPLTVAMVVIFRFANGSTVATMCLMLIKYIAVKIKFSAFWSRHKAAYKRWTRMPQKSAIQQANCSTMASVMIKEEEGLSEIDPPLSTEEPPSDVSKSVLQAILRRRFELGKVSILMAVYIAIFSPVLIVAAIGAILYPIITIGMILGCVASQFLARGLQHITSTRRRWNSKQRVADFSAEDLEEEMKSSGDSVAPSIGAAAVAATAAAALAPAQTASQIFGGVVNFLVTEELPALFLAATVQATVDYALFRYQYPTLTYWEIVAVDFNSRSITCMMSTLRTVFSDDAEKFSRDAQFLTASVPFM